MADDEAAVLPPPPPLPPPCRPHRQLRPRGSRPTADTTPRTSQLVEVFEAALRGNTIAVLDTGSGKTMVAVMLAREHARRVRAGEAPRRIVVFLAPTVHLVHQQFEVIREYTDLDVMMCSGASRVGEWGADHWKEEVGRNEIVVMTPQILLDALRHAFLTMSAVSLLIFDECHRACGSHPYARIMKIYIVEDRNELESFSPPTTIVNKYYDAYMVDFDNLKSKLQIFSDEFDSLLVGLQESPSNKFKDTDNILETSRKSLSRYHGKILYSLNDLGPIITSEVVKIHIESVKPLCDSEDCIFSKASLCLHMSYFKEALSLIEEILPQGYGELMKSESGSEELTKRGYISSKVNTLINIFKSFGSSNEVLCLIFVDRIITAKAVERFMRGIVNFSCFSISYLTGGSTSKDALSPAVQRFTLDLFRAGKVNLLFTTDVTEEGVDVPNCSCVIRFDLPRTVCSYVQSRGRARRNNSEFILMIERGNLQQQEHIFRMIQTGYYVKNCALYRHPNALSYDLSIQGMYTYQVQSTGATITADCCVNLIRKYCEKLPKDRYFMPKPSFEVTIEDGLFKCTLTLPRNAAFQSIVGPLSSSSNLSKQLVSLEACKKLHQLGELNDHLVPLTEEPMDTDFTTADEKCISGPGTTKRKELHGTTCVLALSGTWIHDSENITLNTYRIDFLCDQEGENYAGFVLLMEPELDDDVAPSKMDLFLIPNKMVYTTVTPRGKVQLNKKQLGKGKLFQEFFFNGIFGRLFHGSRKSGAQRDFIFKKGHEIQWNTESMYLLLPLRDSSYIQDDLSIHWEAIESCAGAVEQLWSSYQGDENVIPVNCIPQKRRGGQEEIIHLANKSLHCSSIKDSVVLSLHTGRIYTVLDLILDTTAEDSFDEMYGSTGKPLLMEKEQIHARVPPELLIHLDILEAITTLRCCETFSLERLELLGDSVLKYVVGCDLFLRYPMKHEGQLSDMRSKAVCNATLHKHGIWRSLQGYVRDNAFDPRRWVAPGQISLRPFPCNCGIETAFVPSHRRYIRDDPSFFVGKPCDRGHRWMCSKTISDCVEALVGAYYVGGGIAAALWVMRWFGIDIKCDMKLLQEVKFNASHLCSLSKINDIEELEAKLKYNFSVKGLLLEAITHPSLQELGVDYCYQRLEFLGDSVLDLLLTRHLYATHTDVDPGELTDLRSALVSNENFAQAVVRNNIHSHLQHGSGILLEQITEYVRSNLECQGKESEFLQHTTCKVPKVLGDIMESIAGAVFIDTDFNVDMVWEIFEPLLSPLITPDKLALPPYRELLELCSHIGCFLNSKCTSKGEEVIIEMSLQLRDELLVAQGHDRNKKRAKAKAASRILADLKQQQGLSIKQCLSKAKQLDIVTSDLQFDLTSLCFHSKWRKVDLEVRFSSYARFCSGQCQNSNLWNKGSGLLLLWMGRQQQTSIALFRQSPCTYLTQQPLHFKCLERLKIRLRESTW
ncbi:Os10g0485600 [Oryza sativa Japonica Group]|nr:putative RNA helicase [Oryza sativa Japonica Group]AAP54346.1 Type III restriction enzyme, res subunit family protein, expressed [Oryza sativa Japonica Group]BAF26812.2 Os10g0485600 [Oryza sativa Japonica Group]|eukprot:NP_001064898.2 Os10g0485600 [Oryza sativa Japonica Group]